MTWIYKGDELGMEGIAGVPTRDMTDEEFEAICAEYDLSFPDQPGSLKHSPLYQHTGRTPTATSAPVSELPQEPKTEEVVEKKESE